MSSGRYGKYGETKRLDRLRRARTANENPGGVPHSHKTFPGARRPGGDRFGIRSARRSDAGFIGELSARAFLAYGSYREVIRGWFETGRTTTVVAEAVARPAGFAMAAPLTPGPRPGTELLAIAVEPASRRSGIGRSLLERLEAEVSRLGARSLWLHTAVVNNPARRLFEAAGFAPAELRESFYPSGHDAVLMIKVLGAP